MYDYDDEPALLWCVCVAGQVVAWVLSQLTLSPWEQAGAAGVTPLMLAAQAGATAVLQAMLVRPTYHRCSGQSW